MRGKHEELEIKYGELENQYLQSTETVDVLLYQLRRRTAALCTGFIGLEIKATYCVVLASPGDNQWWANIGQAVAGLALGGYLVWPNILRLLRLSSETASIRSTTKKPKR